MEIRNKINGGIVSVSAEYAERLVASGEYERIEVKKATPRTAKKETKED